MEQENINSQQPVQPSMEPQHRSESRKGAGISLFIFAIIVLLVIALLWNNSQKAYEQDTILPMLETMTPQTNEEKYTEHTTIEAELNELDSQAVVEAL